MFKIRSWTVRTDLQKKHKISRKCLIFKILSCNAGSDHKIVLASLGNFSHKAKFALQFYTAMMSFYLLFLDLLHSQSPAFPRSWGPAFFTSGQARKKSIASGGVVVFLQHAPKGSSASKIEGFPQNSRDIAQIQGGENIGRCTSKDQTLKTTRILHFTDRLTSSCENLGSMVARYRREFSFAINPSKIPP